MSEENKEVEEVKQEESPKVEETKDDKKEDANKDIDELKKAAYEGAYDAIKQSKKGFAFKSIKSDIAVSILKKVILVVVVAALIPLAMSKLNPFSNLVDQFTTLKDVEDYDLTFENNGLLGYKAADFAEVILGDSTKLKKLEVYSQQMSEMVTLTKTGLGNLKIFSKSKYYIYHGTATYVVDLSKLNENCISLDEENNTVILKIPHAELSDINIPLEDMEVGDTDKGILAFGDLNATDDESKELAKKAKENMTEKLEEENIQDNADRVAKTSIMEIYQPMISKAVPGVTLKIEFQEEEKK